METFWVNEIKLWLLDHAAKHDMNNVVKYILQDKATTEHLIHRFSASSAQEDEMQPSSLFLILLEHMKESLKEFKPPDGTNSFSWDRGALNLIIDILDATYKQKQYVSFFTFMKLTKLFKLLVLFRMIYENVDGHEVCGTLNLYFPHWNAESPRNLIQAYGNEAEDHIDDIKETISETRKFILKLLLKARFKRAYLGSNYATDVHKMVQKSMPMLDVVITAVKNVIGPSTIDKIINSTDDTLSSSNNPAVQIILEYLKPDMTADDFLELLKIFEFSDGQEDNMNISFGSPLEDPPFMSCIDKDGIPEENSPQFSVADDDTPPSSNDNLNVPNTERKQYGPLGLGPPSAKKIAVEEPTEVQVVEEHMELVLDSEDEEQL